MSPDSKQHGVASPASDGLVFIALSDDILHDRPLAWMVFCPRGENDYMVFTEMEDAERYAETQAEAEDLPAEKNWPIYALWGAAVSSKPEVFK